VIDYRLSTEATFPAATDDILKALKYFKKNDTTFSIDKDRIVLLGCSAGATLASYVAVRSSEECAALINIDGVVDLTDPNESGKDTEVNKPSAAAMYIGGTFAQCAEKWVEASPLTYANSNSPPVLFINSSQDRFHAGRDAFLQVYQQEGLFYRVKTLPDAPHTFWLFDRWFDETHTEIVHFLAEVFEM
jgi:acetyl esterase/lipase